MLVFCEDCGERNNIDLNAVKKAGNLYRCSSCQFLNQLLAHQAEPKSPDNKRPAPFDKVPYLRILQEISRGDTTVETYVYDAAKGIIAADVSEDFTEKSMLKIGQVLSFCSNMSSKILTQTTEPCLVLTEKVVMAINLEKDSRLIVCSSAYPLPPQVSTIIDKAIANFRVYKK